MAASLLHRLRESLRAFAAVFENPQLRRLELAWSGSILGQWGYEVALAVFAYRDGGARAVGLLGLARLLPAAVAAPFAAVLGDRYSRRTLMLAADLVRAAAMAGAAVAAFAGAPAAVYAFAILVAVTGTTFQPAQSALLPALARTPEELTAVNATSTTIESVGWFAGPALGGLLLAVTSPGAVFAATAATFVWSALLVSRLAPVEPPEVTRWKGIVAEAAAGFRTIARDARLRVVVGLYGVQTLAAGVLRVLVVVTALELLDLGASGVGFLNSAIGVGAILGFFAVLSLIGRERMAAQFGLGIVLWGVPLLLLGAWPTVAGALVFFALLGIGNTLVDVAGFTLLQRTAPDHVRARVFGVLESMFMATIGTGAAVAPLLKAALGTRGALVATGATLPTVTLLAWRQLRAAGAAAAIVPEDELALLRAIPIFAPLPPYTLEELAARVAAVHLPAGQAVFHRGDPGDRFYVIADGEVSVAADARPPVRLKRGDYFGEIALLRDVPRTATVTAETDTELYALDGGDFIAAVTGHAPSAEAANAVIAGRLGAASPGLAPL